MSGLMEIRVISDMKEMTNAMEKFRTKHGVQRNKYIQNVGIKFKNELKRQCLENRRSGNLDRSIIAKSRKGGTEWRVFALSYISKLNKGTPASSRFGGGKFVKGGSSFGSGKLREKIKPYAIKYYNKDVKWLANRLMKGGTKAYGVIDKAKAKVPRFINEELQEFKREVRFKKK